MSTVVSVPLVTYFDTIEELRLPRFVLLAPTLKDRSNVDLVDKLVFVNLVSFSFESNRLLLDVLFEDVFDGVLDLVGLSLLVGLDVEPIVVGLQLVVLRFDL